jgi:hypothetical protein
MRTQIALERCVFAQTQNCCPLGSLIGTSIAGHRPTIVEPLDARSATAQRCQVFYRKR